MVEIGGPVPSDLLRICQKRGFWEDERSRKTKMLRKDGKIDLTCEGSTTVLCIYVWLHMQ